ncbi:MAG TPA: hypothetical protein VF228_19175 [Iamia sp.]
MGMRDRAIEATVLRAIDHAVTARGGDALRRAAATTGTTAERVAQVTQPFGKELAAVGAATGGVAALPGIGTVAALATAAADVGWTTTRACDLVMAIGAVHGHTEAPPAVRKAWVVAVLGYGPQAAEVLPRILAAEEQAAHDRASGRLSGGSLAALNQGFGRTLVTRWAMRKLATSVGKALPFGIGAVIGAVANRASVRTIARHADMLFRTIGDPAPDAGAPEPVVASVG